MPINNEGWIGYHHTQYNGNVSRLKIPEGWIYKFSGSKCEQSPSICFVPSKHEEKDNANK